MEFSAGWKPVPSVSESNPGRSLGIYNHGENCCLEDSTSHRAKHPLNPINPCSTYTSVGFRTRILRIDADEIKYQYIKIQKYIFLCFFLIFIYWCFINVVLSSRQPFLLLVIIPRLRPGLLSLRSVLASSQILLAFYDKISIEKNNKKNREKYICLFLFIDIFSTRQDNQTTNPAKLPDNPDPVNEKK